MNTKSIIMSFIIDAYFGLTYRMSSRGMHCVYLVADNYYSTALIARVHE